MIAKYVIRGGRKKSWVDLATTARTSAADCNVLPPISRMMLLWLSASCYVRVYVRIGTTSIDVRSIRLAFSMICWCYNAAPTITSSLVANWKDCTRYMNSSSIHATKLRNNFLATTIAKKYESTSAMKRKRVQGDCNNNYSACLPSLHILLLIDCSIGSSDWSFDLAVGHHQC